ncbi:D-aminoacyl-tRNA deacylase [Thermostilla marina]
MIACVQRVTRASVTVGEKVVGEIERGVVVLLGVAAEDTEDDARLIAGKLAGLRIFEDGDGKMNLSIRDVAGKALVISQFTLLADCRKGRRPSFTAAAPPEPAEALYRVFCDQLKEHGIPVATGVFRAHMEVALVNDGPVTILLDSTSLKRPRRG